ncbi:GNAT family acetyltransferase [Sporothrix schenckii 1099-18]|uniref:GNAT family acetyltransferase n=1 Tax=Sporothrix schenckii 1099-18 TaxID=1397361 RepID=A0A0F2M8Z0_SPOSC|nr:GNAT family acetyltransferase [Sporothrix schenckii 1099-18]KJR85290.1 GNAT family acetyltransferase [Sporothrix schenckii 1099-18]
MAAPTGSPPLTWRTSVPVPGPMPTDAKDTANNNVAATPSEEHFICSSDVALIQLDALHDAMSSDLMWWAKPLSRPQLVAMVTNSLCLGVYTADSADGAPQSMVGFGRLVTDRVTFAYLTDVYVLPAYQRRGLGAWMMRCLRELCHGSEPDRAGSVPSADGWPNLRSLWLVASTESAARMYMGALGAEEAARYRPQPGVPGSGMLLVEMPGPANSIRNHAKRNEEAKAAAGT